MIEASEINDSDKFELVTVNGDIVIQVDESSTFAGGGGEGSGDVQSLLGEHEQKGEWMEVCDSTPLTLNPPIIQDENSSDKLIGHLEEFEIQTADDGTLLPSTAKAKMADGTYRRITLYPQLADGGVTCMVHFENEVPHIEEQMTSLSDKIDSIICQNESIISRAKAGTIQKEEPQSLLKPLSVRSSSVNGKPKNSLYYPNKEVIESTYQFIKHKEKLRKLTSKVPTPPLTDDKYKPTLSLETFSDSTVGPCSPSSSNDADIESSGICIKTSPEYFSTAEKNDQRLGSNENPITLLQSGQVYHSQQPLSETQLRHLSSILKSQRSNPNSRIDKNVLIDPKTKAKIVYRVVYPDEDSNPSEEKTKRVKKVKAKTKDLLNNVEEASKSPVVKLETETLKEIKSDLPILLKSARTRSGRLSRPPKYMIRDYKRLQLAANGLTAKKPDGDMYVDYKSADEEPAPAPALENPPFFLSSARKKGKKNFKSEYRCPTCQKIYLGHAKMMLHLRKFPDHSNLDEYLEIYSRARNERKKRPLNVFKLKQVISGVDKSSYGPLLANSFSIWDFLLFRIDLLHKKGEGDGIVEAMLKELSCLLEKLSKMAEELLSPVYDENMNQDYTYVSIDKLEIAYALGIPQGTYKINSDKLDILRLTKDEPPAPPPPPPKPLATKFEPNLSTKLMECSNDSIDLDGSSKDVETEDDKKDWSVAEKVDENNCEFLTDFLQSELPSSEGESLSLWKSNTEVQSSPPHGLTEVGVDQVWKKTKTSPPPTDDLPLWKDGIENTGASIWKESTQPADEATLSSWNERRENGVWKADVVETEDSCEPPMKKKKDTPSDMWSKKPSGDEHWASDASGKDGKKDWLRQWKEETGGPGMRSARLTSTPETHGASALLSPPLRRNSVSSFARSHQEELLNLEFHELFGDLMPEQGKPRRPKPSSIESILNEALFAGNEPPSSHTTLPTSLIPDALDEVTSLDFLSHS